MQGSTSVVVVPSGSYEVDGFVTVTGGCIRSNSASANMDGIHQHIPLNVVEEVAGVPLPDVLGHLEDCINGHFDLGVPPTKEVARTALEGMFPVPRSLSKREQKRRRERDPADEAPVDPQPDSYGWSLEEGGSWRFRFNPSPAPSGHVYLATSTPAPRRTLHIIDPHLSDSVLRALVLSPGLGKVVEGVTGWGPGMVRVMESQLWLKPPRCGMPLAFHRDTPYFNFLADTDTLGADIPVEVCTLWITFDDVSTWEGAVSRGALEYVKGSHRWGVGTAYTSKALPLWRSADYIEEEEKDEEAGSEGDDVSPNGAPKGLQRVFFDTDYHAPMHSAAVQMYKGAIPPSLSKGDVANARKQRAHQLHHLQRAGYLAPPSTTTYTGCVPPTPETAVLETPPKMTHLVQLPAGGCTIHNGNTWHGSGANSGTTSDHWRRGIGIHYVKATAHFKACYAEDSTATDTRPLSTMWAGHKQPGTLSLNPVRFPVVN